MLSAAFSLAFHGLLWVSEYMVLSDKAFKALRHATLSDIQWYSQHFTLFLRRSKTGQAHHDQLLQAHQANLPIPQHGHIHCPSISQRPTLFCFSNGRPLTRLRLLKHLRCQLQHAGYHPHQSITHTQLQNWRCNFSGRGWSLTGSHSATGRMV